MSRTVLYSKKDKAGANIAGILRERFGVRPVSCEVDVLYLEDAGILPPGTDLCIVASKHKSLSGTPTLTVHSPGNFGAAKAGGRAGELAIAPALFLREALLHIIRKKPDGYEAGLEVTHHGPTSLPFPVMFVEVGSTIKEWNDPLACSVAAETISGLFNKEPLSVPAAIGFGGGHYCRKFSLVRDYALGHICPKYALRQLGSGIVDQMIEKTLPRPQAALVEKKGLGVEKKRITGILEEKDLDVVLI